MCYSKIHWTKSWVRKWLFNYSVNMIYELSLKSLFDTIIMAVLQGLLGTMCRENAYLQYLGNASTWWKRNLKTKVKEKVPRIRSRWYIFIDITFHLDHINNDKNQSVFWGETPQNFWSFMSPHKSCFIAILIKNFRKFSKFGVLCPAIFFEKFPEISRKFPEIFSTFSK